MASSRPGKGKPKRGANTPLPVPGTRDGEPVPHQGRKVKDVTRNRHRHDREAVFDDGDQVLNDNLGESVTTGAIAAPMASFPGTPQHKGPARSTSHTSSRGKTMATKHKMPQTGKPITGKTVKKDTTGAQSTELKDHGEPFGKKQKNTGGQFEKFKGGGKGDGSMKEHLSPAEIANTLTDDGGSLQELFNNYARGVNYVSLREFNEIARAYGCHCHDERQLSSLMEVNNEFMFIEGVDGGGKFWVPQLLSEGGDFGGKKAPPFGSKDAKGKKTDGWDDAGNESGEEEGDEDEGDSKSKSKKPWEEDAQRGNVAIHESEASSMKAIVESVTAQGPLNEMGFQYDTPAAHFDRFKDPGYADAQDEDLGDFPFLDNAETDETVGADDLMGGEYDLENDPMDGAATRGGDTYAGREGADVGSGTCPQCRVPMDELGCPDCGYVEDEFEQNRFDDPSDVASNLDSHEEFFSGDSRRILDNDLQDEETGSGDDLMDLHGMGDEYADEFQESAPRGRRRRPVNEDKHEMESPTGRGVQPHPGRSGGKKSGLPETDTELKDMGKEWPRRQKNTGGAYEEFGDSKHGTPGHEGMQDHGDPFGKKQKNTGGQFEEFEGGQHDGKLTGGAQKMYEGVNLLASHVRKTLAEMARSSNLMSERGRYPMRFLVSVGEHVKPKAHNQLTEALADAEELVQVFGPEAVSFEAQFCRQDGSVAMKRLVPMIRVPQRAPIVQESATGSKLLFRFPEVARDYADIVVQEGRACRAVTHNWGAAVSAKLTMNEATQVFNMMKRKR